MKRSSKIRALCLLLLTAAACGDPAPAPSPAHIGTQTSELVTEADWVEGTEWPAETIVALKSFQAKSRGLIRGDVAVITENQSGGGLLNGAQADLGITAELEGNLSAHSIFIDSGGHIFGQAAYNTLTNNGLIDGTHVTPLTP